MRGIESVYKMALEVNNSPRYIDLKSAFGHDLILSQNGNLLETLTLTTKEPHGGGGLVMSLRAASVVISQTSQIGCHKSLYDQEWSE